MIDLTEHERLEAAAKPAPWTSPWGHVMPARAGYLECQVSEKDAELVVYLRNTHREVMQEIRTLRELCRSARLRIRTAMRDTELEAELEVAGME